MSDHFSGPRALAGPSVDITDFYAFPSPQTPGALCLVLCVHPLATPTDAFSSAISHNIRIRPVTPNGSSVDLADEPSEIAFNVTFGEPDAHGAQSASLLPTRGAASPFHGGPPPTELPRVEFVVGEVSHDDNAGLKVYAGLRSDPFFIDLTMFQASIQSGTSVIDGTGTNSIPGADVLTLVVEIDIDTWLADGGPLVAIAAETIAATGVPVRFERVGRPEVKNVMLQWRQFDPVNSDIELRDLYNLEDPFHMGKDYLQAYRTRLNANLHALDRLDGNVDWPLDANSQHPLTDLMLGDYLILDITKPYSETSFFEIEKALLAGQPHHSAGGRSLNDDVMTTIYTVLIAGGNGPKIDDGVDQATVRASDAFPYLAPANSGTTQ